MPAESDLYSIQQEDSIKKMRSLEEESSILERDIYRNQILELDERREVLQSIDDRRYDLYGLDHLDDIYTPANRRKKKVFIAMILSLTCCVFVIFLIVSLIVL